MVLPTKHTELLMESEGTMMWRPQNVVDTTTENLRYPIVSQTQNLCNPKKNASTPSIKVSTDHNGDDSNISSKRMMVNFSGGIEDEDDVFEQRKEQEPLRHTVFCTRCTLDNKICLLIIDGNICDCMVFANLVKKLKLKIGFL